LKVLDTLWGMFGEGQSVQDGQIVWPWYRRQQIAEGAGLPDATVRLVLEDLMLLNLVVRAVEAGSNNAHIWQPSKYMYEWAINSELFIRA
jgi:hypothetical protein